MYDVIVIGAGHAGCEAGLAAARAGCRTAVLTPNLDRVGYMPCNPSVGGPGKSHIVAEVDALGGEMARAADRTAVQIKQLNSSKGPAVRAVRVLCDKQLYALAMKETLEKQANLDLIQDEATALVIHQDRDRPAAAGVRTRLAGELVATSVIVTAGTFLRASMISGERRTAGGRAGDHADIALAGSLQEFGFHVRRLKTGTPPRIDARTVDLSLTERQRGDDEPRWLSRDGREATLDLLTLSAATFPHLLTSIVAGRPQLLCFKTATNEATHELIRRNLHRAPMYNGAIDGVGPRYCPSIEDKIGRFAGKASHPVFLEPEGWRSGELYAQGMSTSLPPDVQDAVLRTIPALRQARITRYGYAVEYDAVDPSELTLSLETKRVDGLFLAGQINGTSGYEEAAGQGILAGINAAARVQSRKPLILGRDQAYIGVMIDDLVSRPLDEPYRMLTSRAEFRLLLRSDTADARLTVIAHERGLVEGDRAVAVASETDDSDALIAKLERIWFGANPGHAALLARSGLAPVSRSMSALELVRRPGVSLGNVLDAIQHLKPEFRTSLSDDRVSRAETTIKYGAFIEKEAAEAAKQRAHTSRPLPSTFVYHAVPGLRIEAQQKLAGHRPQTLGQAMRLTGVTPSDISALMVHMRRIDVDQRSR
ncbi:MAG: tRNA uridine-5-carboxymethylaminomethyl(34) synthesis enzyme MnmG [Chloroflexia bacterium]|nr:tRNA uridine-5-carboxymethylaminomethyl(34) synthesis enzyme MnmG [Chloroflexia bacterium]